MSQIVLDVFSKILKILSPNSYVLFLKIHKYNKEHCETKMSNF